MKYGREEVGVEWWDPRAAHKEALSFSIAAVSTTACEGMVLGRRRMCVRRRESATDGGQSDCVGSRQAGR